MAATCTSRFLTVLSLSIMMLTRTVVLVSAGSYRLGATKYSLTMTSTLEMKNENCRSNFGDDSSLVDMDAVKSDFDSEADFNQALATVFFKQPTTAFMVLYKGSDSPPNSKDPNLKYAIRTDAPSTSFPSVTEFGHARVIVYNHEAPILCTVPTSASQDVTRKVYVPKDATTSNATNNAPRSVVFSWVLVSLVVGVIGLVVRKSNVGAYYYNYLGSEAPRHRGHSRLYDHDEDSGDLGANLTAGCELSYNPAAMAAPAAPGVV